jgi:hypothetical protein
MAGLLQKYVPFYIPCKKKKEKKKRIRPKEPFKILVPKNLPSKYKSSWPLQTACDLKKKKQIFTF